MSKGCLGGLCGDRDVSTLVEDGRSRRILSHIFHLQNCMLHCLPIIQNACDDPILGCFHEYNTTGLARGMHELSKVGLINPQHSAG